MGRVQTQIEVLKSEIASRQDRLRVLEELGEIDGVGSIFVSSWDNRIDLTATDPGETRSLALKVLGRVRDLGIRALKAVKKFDPENGKVTFEIPGPQGFRLQVEGGDARCRVKAVTETIEIPEKVTPARIETRTRYVIENPEECGALAEGEAARTAVLEAPADDIPF